jgi:hypothetical protein
MSIATLKRKTKTQYNNISVGQPAFSLNGTRRSQGYVGQTSLSRSLPRTLMNGSTPRGHGGCCGKYPTTAIVQSAVTSLNNPNVVKTSVITTNGMIEERMNNISNINQKYFITCGPSTTTYNQWKADNNQNLNNQDDYIRNKAKKTIQKSNLACNIKNTSKPCNNACAIYYKNLFSNIKFFSRSSYVNYVKPKSDYVAISQGEHLINKTNNCTSHDITATVPRFNPNIRKTPFACGL